MPCGIRKKQTPADGKQRRNQTAGTAGVLQSDDQPAVGSGESPEYSNDSGGAEIPTVRATSLRPLFTGGFFVTRFFVWTELSSRRIAWAPNLDHAVTTAHVRVGHSVSLSASAPNAVADAVDRAPLVCGRRPRLMHLPSNLLERRRVLDEAAVQFRALVVAASPLPTTLNELNAELTRFMRLSHERALESVCGDVE
jgi:hypothetical protein